MIFLISTVFLFTTKAFACPDLSGNFLCKGDGVNPAVKIQVTLYPGSTTYRFKNETNGQIEDNYFSADGKVRKIKDPAYKQLLERVYCEGTNLFIEQIGWFKNPPVRTKVVEQIFLDENSALKSILTTAIDSRESTGIDICDRVK